MTSSSSPSNRSRTARRLAGAAVVALVFLWITWPLPKHFHTGIAASHRPEAGGARIMMPGDHLQLQYHFELMKRFLTGETPWFHNLYEFNTGDDEDTFAPDAYYAPFSLIYALGSMAGLPELGWNLASLASVLFGFWGMWLLVRRFRAPWALSLAATLCGVMIPYRWITLLHGSPTGFAMAYVPWILLGLDVSIRSRRMWGGWVAGACLLLSALGDIHTFFFSALLSIPWCLLCFLHQEKPSLSLPEIKSLLRALSGFIVFGLLVLAQAWFIRQYLQEGTMAEGRTIQEVLLYSPTAAGFWNPNPNHPHNLIHLPYAATAFAAISLLFGLLRLLQHRTARELRFFALHLLLLLGIGIVMLLALGPRMAPAGGIWWERLTRVFPPYAMIRQPAKIFAVLPVMIAVFLILPFADWRPKSSRFAAALALLLSLAVLAETDRRITPSVSIGERENAAYAAIRENADRLGEDPRALVIVLWPGDSHWASLYQHYSIQYGIRMVNGYRPHVPDGYFDEVFKRFLGLNQGYASDPMLRELLDRGIRHLILHEDAFPEQVSPFGVGQTLGRLLEDPRIRLLAQDHATWAFEIMPEPSPEHSIPADWMRVASPTMVWDLSRSGSERIEVVPDTPDAQGHGFARLRPGEDFIQIHPYETFSRGNLHLALRSRGAGALHAEFTFDDAPPVSRTLSLDTEEWAWNTLPFPDFDGFAHDIQITLRAREGELDLDTAITVEGQLPTDLAVGDSLFVPATALFHAGHTDLDDQTVVLHPDRVPAAEVIYGPRLPLPAGQYRVSFAYQASDAPAELGRLRVSAPDPSPLPEPVPVPGGQSETSFEFTHPANFPVTLAFHYHRTHPMRVKGLTLHRIQ